MLDNSAINNITEINTPIIPDILAKNINTSRHIFIGFATSLLMNISSLIAVIAMTITKTQQTTLKQPKPNVKNVGRSVLTNATKRLINVFMQLASNTTIQASITMTILNQYQIQKQPGIILIPRGIQMTPEIAIVQLET